MQLPTSVPLKGSRLLAAVVGFAHAVAGGAVLSTDLSWLLRGAIAALLVASLAWILLRLRRPTVLALHLGAKGDLEIETKVGVRETAQLLSESLVLPDLIVLAVRWGGKRRALTLLPDAVGPEGHRQLRVWLKWRASIG